MALAEADLELLQSVLRESADGIDVVRSIRSGLPELRVTRCDAADMRDETPFSSVGRFDVFLVDWRMEPMDGIETLAALRGQLSIGAPPRIAQCRPCECHGRSRAMEMRLPAECAAAPWRGAELGSCAFE